MLFALAVFSARTQAPKKTPNTQTDSPINSKHYFTKGIYEEASRQKRAKKRGRNSVETR